MPVSAGAISLVMSWHWFVAPINTEFVVTLYALIGGLLPIQACRALWIAREEPELRGVRRFVALAFAGFALITLLRALLGLIDGLQGIEHVDVTRSVPYLLPYNFGIPLWLMALAGTVTLPSAFDPLSWHRHEMLFGFVGAVVAGFLLTAIPNWTDRTPIRGKQLIWLAIVWLAAIDWWLALPLVAWAVFACAPGPPFPRDARKFFVLAS